MASTGQTLAVEEAETREGLLPNRPEPGGHHQVHAPGWHRSTQTETAREGELCHDHQGPADELRVPDSQLWCRGAYDAEAEGRRHANLGLNLSAWDRYMIQQGPRRKHGGTWVMLDSEGVHFAAHDPGDGL